MISRKRKLVFLLMVLSALASGCRSGGDSSLFGRRGNRSLDLVVENNNFLDITVYALGAGASLRLGDVSGKSTATFRIDPRKVSLASGLQLSVDPLGSSRIFTSRLIFPDRAASVLLFVAAELEVSYVTIR